MRALAVILFLGLLLLGLACCYYRDDIVRLQQGYQTHQRQSLLLAGESAGKY